ncbi:MAG: hypothetical protein IJP63_03620 [Acholeplasmatales bacterium]|nr:hypothetical protein [Acholeplasmatales bacterium]
MKRAYIFMLSLLLMIGIVIVASFAWFTNSEFIEPDLSGFSISAYFGGGDGSSEDPYQIKNPRHLYNLAWLQYLGYFNNPGTGNTPNPNSSSLTQYSFEITEDLPMSGWVLPPIGTSEQPFIGLLNGNGHKITNLQTSNEFHDFGSRHPNTVTATSYINAEIIGFIGAIGEISTMEDYGHTISSAANAVANIKLVNTIISSSTDNTLVGIAAGYINGKVEDVGIVNGTIDVIGSTKLDNMEEISSFTVAGYAEDDYLIKVSNNKAIVLNPTNTYKTKFVFEDEGNITGWGGSIDMATMYSHIFTQWSSGYSAGHTYKYYSKATFVHNSDGTITENYDESSLKEDRTYNSDFVRMYATETYNGQVIAQYTLFHRDNQDRFMYLAGQTTRTISNGLTITHQYPGAFYISQGNNYITYNNSSSVKNVTSQSSASYWYQTNEGRIYTIYNNNKYYLVDDLGTLSLSTSSSTSWTIGTSTILAETGNYLVYSEGSWTLNNTSTSATNGYKISYSYNNTTYYLNADVNNLETTYTTNVNNATTWFTDDNNYLYTIVNNVYYYLTSPNNRGREMIELSTKIESYSFIKSGNASYFIGRQSNKYYLQFGYDYYNILDWNANTTSSRTLTWTSSQIVDTAEVITTSKANTTETTTASYSTGPTYFPLMFDEDGGISDKNTGYVCCGSYYNTSGQNTDIRVSEYYVSDITNSWNNTSKTLTNIRTINSSGDKIISDTSIYSKYSNSKASLEKVINETLTSSTSSSPLYGLHFMNALISTDHTIVAPYLKINNEKYTDYELPEDSIDFMLKEKGYINFFAGSYFSGNNSFFSLNQIVRNGNSISEIRRIVEIYSDGNNSHSYVYRYSDGKYSVPYQTVEVNGEKVKQTLSGGTYIENSTQNSLASGYNSVFKTSWIEKQSSLNSDYVYYFEIPTNEGEYALGSVSGGEGAYLLYLDIGANAQEVDRTEIRQKSMLIKSDYFFPKGIAIIDENTTINALIGTDSLNPAESAVARFNQEGSVSVTRTNTTTITINANQVDITSTYVPRGVTLTKGSGAIIATAVKTTTSIYSQIQYIDYNLTTNEIFETNLERITVIGDTTTTYTPTVKIYNYTTGDEIDLTEANPAWKLYGVIPNGTSNKNRSFALINPQDDSDGYGSERTTLYNALITAFEEIDADTTSTSILEFDYDTLESATNTYEIVMKAVNANDNTGMYYMLNGDEITVTTDDSDASKIYVTVADTTYTLKIKNTTIQSVPTEISW